MFDNPVLLQTLFMTLCVGLFSGLMGSFVVLKKMSQLQDVLGHAVFPGILIAFAIIGVKDNSYLYLGAFLSVLLALALIFLFRKLKTRTGNFLSLESSQGLVLVGVFSVSIWLFSLIDNDPSYGVDKSGLKDFLFGQLAAVTPTQTAFLFVLMFLFFVFVGSVYRSWAFACFDRKGALHMGVPVRRLEIQFFVFQALFMTVALQAAGLVLVAGFLIIPAAISLLLTKQVDTYIVLSTLVGAVGTFMGALVSMLNPGIPTGPTAVLVLFLFLVGVLSVQFLKQFLRKIWNEKDIQNQNSLKNIYQYLERDSFASDKISESEYAAFRNITLKESHKQLQRLCRDEMLSRVPGEKSYLITPKGWQEAFKIIRAHRLWEMYLLKTKGMSKEDVHLDAEFKEHLLTPQEISQVEASLRFPLVDPHGKKIPGVWQRRSKNDSQ